MGIGLPPPKQAQLEHHGTRNAFRRRPNGARRQLKILGNFDRMLVGQGIEDLFIAGAVAQAA
jgi:hypothetical protein